MEGLSSLKGLSSNGTSRTRKVVPPEPSSDDLSSLLSNESGEKQHRIGARVRAWAEAFECLDKAEAEGWEISDLRAHMEAVRDGKVVTPTTRKGTGGKQKYYVGVSHKGNRIFLQHNGDPEALKADFGSLYLFNKKSEALDYVQLNELNTGMQVF